MAAHLVKPRQGESSGIAAASEMGLYVEEVLHLVGQQQIEYLVELSHGIGAEVRLGEHQLAVQGVDRTATH